MNEELQLRMRKVVKSALDDFADQQVNIASENAREAIALRVASDIVKDFAEDLTSDREMSMNDHVQSELRKHFIF
jgi:hypothetical protein